MWFSPFSFSKTHVWHSFCSFFLSWVGWGVAIILWIDLFDMVVWYNHIHHALVVYFICCKCFQWVIWKRPPVQICYLINFSLGFSWQPNITFGNEGPQTRLFCDLDNCLQSHVACKRVDECIHSNLNHVTRVGKEWIMTNMKKDTYIRLLDCETWISFVTFCSRYWVRAVQSSRTIEPY